MLPRARQSDGTTPTPLDLSANCAHRPTRACFYVPAGGPEALGRADCAGKLEGTELCEQATSHPQMGPCLLNLFPMQFHADYTDFSGD